MSPSLAPSVSPLIGHQDLWEQMSMLHTAQRLPHGLLLTGLQGIGKRTFAWHLAAKLIAGHPVALQDALYDRLLSGACGDFLEISPSTTGRGQIDVAAAREVSDFFSRTAFEGGGRVVLIREAHLLNEQAANSLLKILEEPPPNCFLLFITHKPEGLKLTLRSRLQIFSFKPLSKEETETVFAQSQLSVPHLSFPGQPGIDLSLQAYGGLKLRSSLQESLSAVVEGGAHRIDPRFIKTLGSLSPVKGRIAPKELLSLLIFKESQSLLKAKKIQAQQVQEVGKIFVEGTTWDLDFAQTLFLAFFALTPTPTS